MTARVLAEQLEGRSGHRGDREGGRWIRLGRALDQKFALDRHKLEMSVWSPRRDVREADGYKCQDEGERSRLGTEICELSAGRWYLKS